MINIAKLCSELDTRLYSSSTVVKVNTYYYNTIAQRCDVGILRFVVYAEDAYILFVFRKRYSIKEIAAFFEVAAPFIDNVSIL